MLYTYKDIENKIDITRNALEKRVKILKIIPIKKGRLIFFEKKDYEKIINYIPTKRYDKKQIKEKKIFYRISIYNNHKWIIKHFNLNYEKAQQIISEYEKKNIYPKIIKYEL